MGRTFTDLYIAIAATPEGDDVIVMHSIQPGTQIPLLGLTPEDAREMAEVAQPMVNKRQQALRIVHYKAQEVVASLIPE